MAGRGTATAVLALLAALGAGGCQADVDLVPGDAAAVTGAGATTGTPTTVSAPTGSPPATSSATSSATGPSASGGPSSPAGASTAVLPAGGYDVLLTSVDAAGRRLTVDVVDYLTGDPAVRACREDGGHGTGESCQNGYVRNTPSPVRTLPVTGTAAITMSPAINPRPATLAEVAAGLPARNLYSMRVDGGQVAKLDEIYRP